MVNPKRALLVVFALLAAGGTSAADKGTPATRAPALSGRAAWRYKALDWRALYMPSADEPGSFDAVSLHQGYTVEHSADPALKDIFGPAGQSRITDDDEVAGKDFQGRDRIRFLTDGRGGARLEVDYAVYRRDNTDMTGVAARYVLPLAPFGNGWAVPLAKSRRHFDEQARLQGEVAARYLRDSGWRVTDIVPKSTPPAGEHALRLVPEAGGWRFISGTPFTIGFEAKVSR